MLVLVRKQDESFFIGNSVEVIVLGIQGNRVKLGIKAPGKLKILRSELERHEDDGIGTDQRLDEESEIFLELTEVD